MNRSFLERGLAFFCIGLLFFNMACTHQWWDAHPKTKQTAIVTGKVLLVVLLLAVIVVAVYAVSQDNNSSTNTNPKEHWVQPYTREDGTYVPGYWATNPNETIRDNYSTYPNINPHTGQIGTIHPVPGSP